MYSRGFAAAMAFQEPGPVKTGRGPIVFSIDATNAAASGSAASSNVHWRVFDDSGLKSAGPLPKCAQNLGRAVRRCALGTGLLGEDDPGGRKRTAILAP